MWSNPFVMTEGTVFILLVWNKKKKVNSKDLFLSQLEQLSWRVTLRTSSMYVVPCAPADLHIKELISDTWSADK